jgi:hypothetical protein
MTNPVGRPKRGALTKPKPLRFDKDIYEILLKESKFSGIEVADQVRQILRKYYQH